LDLSDFDYHLPPHLIAQAPAPERARARLLVLDRVSGELTHASVADLPTFLKRGDLLVVNNTRVFPARLLGRRVPSGGAVECLLLGRREDDRWDALVHPGQKLGPHARAVFEANDRRLHIEVVARHFHGRRTIRVWRDEGGDVDEVIDAIGHVPLPPYIKRSDQADDRDRYQTLFARVRGSVAAPTAGLHFTPKVIDDLAKGGIERVEITLHVGYGTFKPIRSACVEDHHVDAETYEVPAATADEINRALDEKRRVIAVGTTTTRTLETAARLGGGRLVAGAGVTDLYIHPGFSFNVVGALITNFHLPRSSLLVLVCAFAGRDRILAAYQEAVTCGYRFYSYGDAMLIL
jgi:S-adenosylmethionine:tRNA ribosyltransferase-isomerase